MSDSIVRDDSRRVPYEELRTYLADHAPLHDLQYDGSSSFTITRPPNGWVKEFGSSDVYYVNGVATPMRTHLDNAEQYSIAINCDVTLIHDGTAQENRHHDHDGDRAPDLVKAILEHEIPAFAYQQKPEQAVAKAILSHVEIGKDGSLHVSRDMHFAAHSRGAIITQRGIELADLALEADGASADFIRRVIGHIKLESTNSTLMRDAQKTAVPELI